MIQPLHFDFLYIKLCPKVIYLFIECLNHTFQCYIPLDIDLCALYIEQILYDFL
jgi:hypothetical protein